MPDPDRQSELNTLSEEAHAFFAQKHAARERALNLSRTTTQLSANAIRSAHRSKTWKSKSRRTSPYIRSTQEGAPEKTATFRFLDKDKYSLQLTAHRELSLS